MKTNERKVEQQLIGRKRQSQEAQAVVSRFNQNNNEASSKTNDENCRSLSNNISLGKHKRVTMNEDGECEKKMKFYLETKKRKSQELVKTTEQVTLEEVYKKMAHPITFEKSWRHYHGIGDKICKAVAASQKI